MGTAPGKRGRGPTRTALLLLAGALLAGVVVHAGWRGIVTRFDLWIRDAPFEEPRHFESGRYGLLGLTSYGNTRGPYPAERHSYSDALDRLDQLGTEYEGDEWIVERDRWSRMRGKVSTLRRWGWLIVVVGGAGALGAGILAWRRHAAARWVLAGAYLAFGAGLAAVRPLVAQAFIEPILSMDSPGFAYLRWHPAALIWLGWTVLAVAFALIPGRRRDAPA